MAIELNPNNLNTNTVVTGEGTGVKAMPTISDADHKKRQALVADLGKTEKELASVGSSFQTATSSSVESAISNWTDNQRDAQIRFDASISQADSKVKGLEYTAPNGEKIKFDSWNNFDTWYNSGTGTDLKKQSNTYNQKVASVTTLQQALESTYGEEIIETVDPETGETVKTHNSAWESDSRWPSLQEQRADLAKMNPKNFSLIAEHDEMNSKIQANRTELTSATSTLENFKKAQPLVQQKENIQAQIAAIDKANPTQITHFTPEEPAQDNGQYQYMKTITKDSSDSDKKVPSPVDDVAGEGKTKVNSAQYLQYLQNPEKYTDKWGGDFARSDIGTKYLSPMKPSDQCKATTTMAGMLNDQPRKSYPLKDGEDPAVGHYVLETTTKNDKGEDIKTRMGLNPETPEEKELCKDMRNKNLLTGGPMGSAQSGQIPGNANAAANNTSPNTPQPEPPKSKTFSEDKYQEHNTKKDLLKIGHFDDIPYFRVNGYSKLKFPNVWAGRYRIPIMGLPPMRVYKKPEEPIPLISTNAFDLISVPIDEQLPESYVYNEDEQLMKSFLTLTIHPIDVEFLNGANGDKEYYNDRYKAKGNDQNNQYKHDSTRSVVVWDVDYKFAVQVDENNISISHNNNYDASTFENQANRFINSFNGVAREAGGLLNVSGGYSQLSKGGGALLNKWGGQAQQGLNDMIGGLEKTMDRVEGLDQDLARDFISDLKSLGNTVVNGLAGGRVDLPDIWVDSKTNISYTVKIELRTMCPNPLDIQYHKDILIPLYILYTLALPQDVGKIGYKTPPYIYCNLDKFFKIKLGAITSMNVDLNLKEVNFRRAPRHVTVTLTIRDLYSVMKQDVFDEHNVKIESDNGDTTDKDEFINNFVKYAEDLSNKPIVNEPYYLTEFAKIPAYLDAMEIYKKNYLARIMNQIAASGINSLSKEDKKNLANMNINLEKLAQPAKEGAEKTVQLNGSNFITSIGNVITGVTKGVKNVIAGVQKAIQPVRGLINTGKLVMNSVNGLKSAVKLVGQTANLDDILNGKFASSVGFAFSNFANATDVVQKISNGCLSGKGLTGIVNVVGQIPQAVLTNNIANCITNTGSINLSDQVRDSACSMYALANMFGSTYANVVGLKNLGSSGGDIFDKAQSLFENIGGIVNGVDSFAIGQSAGNTTGVYVDPMIVRYVNSMTKGMIDKGLITANNVSSNTKLQKTINEVSQIGTGIITNPDEVKGITAIFESANEKAFQAEVNAIKKMNGVSEQVAKGIATAKMFINQDL